MGEHSQAYFGNRDRNPRRPQRLLEDPVFDISPKQVPGKRTRDHPDMAGESPAQS